MAADQYGLISLAQARGAGIPEEVFRGLTRSRQWERVLPGVLRLPGYPASWLQEMKALTLWGGEGTCAASHRAAAALYRMPGFAEGVREVITTKQGRTGKLVVVVHRGTPVKACLTEVKGIPTMNALFTLMALGSVVSRAELERAVDDALYRGLVSVKGLLYALERHRRHSLQGAKVLARLVGSRELGYIPPEGQLEADFIALLVRAGLALPLRQVRLGANGRHDFYYPDLSLVAELDGRETHWHWEAFQRDRERDNLLVIGGKRVVRYTWYDVHSRPDYVINQLVELGVPRIGEAGYGVTPAVARSSVAPSSGGRVPAVQAR